MAKKIKHGWVEVPAFNLKCGSGPGLTIFTYQHVPRKNRASRRTHRTMVRAERQEARRKLAMYKI